MNIAIDSKIVKVNPVKAIQLMLSNMIRMTGNIVKFTGRKRVIRMPDGEKLQAHFEIVSISDLITSHTLAGNENPNFPQELQPRDRQRESSQAWINKISNIIDPESLGNSSRIDTGAPIVGSDLIVESGNGRVLALTQAYKNGKAGEYVEWLYDECDYFGFSAQQLDMLIEPILVRIMDSAIDRVKFTMIANTDDKLSYTATEKARTDAKLLNQDLISLFSPSDDGDILSAKNYKFLDAFLSKLSIAESAQYKDKNGEFTQSFVIRVQQALFAKAYNDDRLLEMMADQHKPELKNMINALVLSSTKFIEAQAYKKGDTDQVSESIVLGIDESIDKDLAKTIVEATNTINKARRNDQSIFEYVKQQGLFENIPDEVSKIAIFIIENNRSAKKMSKFFNLLATYVKDQRIDSNNLNMFGEPEPISVANAVDYAFNQFYKDDESGMQSLI